MATPRRTPRSPLRKANPVRDLVSQKQRAAELARSRQRVEQLQADLPSLIQDQVGEHMQKLEDKLVSDFRQLGQRAIEESTTVLNDELSGRIHTLEKVSALQSKTLTNLRDSSKVADQKVSSVMDTIERSISSAVPGFKLEPSAYPDPIGDEQPYAEYDRLNYTEMVRADPQDLEGIPGRFGYCPKCTSRDVRRATRQGALEHFLRLFFIAPFRCRACRHKFFRF